MKPYSDKYLEEYFRYRKPYVELSLGKILIEEKYRIGLDNKIISLVISKIPDYSLNLREYLKAIYETSDYVSRIGRGEYRIQINEEEATNLELFRRGVRHELYHIKFGHCDVVDKVVKAFPKKLALIIVRILNGFMDRTIEHRTGL